MHNDEFIVTFSPVYTIDFGHSPILLTLFCPFLLPLVPSSAFMSVCDHVVYVCDLVGVIKVVYRSMDT